MKRFALLLFSCALLGQPCLAANTDAVERESLMAAPAPAQAPSDKKADKEEKDEPLTPDQQALLICQTADIMSGQAGPDYEEGVDAYGRPVAPADGGQQFTIPDEVEVPIAVDVMDALGIKSPKGVKGEANFGSLKVLKGGQLFYNGTEITNTVEGYCRAHMKKMEKKK